MNIQYGIKAIETKHFDINYDNYDRNKQGSTFDLQTNYAADDELFIVQLQHRLIIFQEENTPIARLAVDYTFQLLKKEWQSLYQSNGAFIVPKGLVMVFNNIAVGTTRGILHAKLENTPFSTYYLPPVILEDLVKDDLPFIFSSED